MKVHLQERDRASEKSPEAFERRGNESCETPPSLIVEVKRAILHVRFDSLKLQRDGHAASSHFSFR